MTSNQYHENAYLFPLLFLTDLDMSYILIYTYEYMKYINMAVVYDFTEPCITSDELASRFELRIWLSYLSYKFHIRNG